MIQIRNVSYSYHNKRVLNNINLSIEKGEFVLILGPSGGGKTTLCQAVNGIIPNDIKGTEFIGEVTIDGRSTINQSIGLAGCEVGTVLQDPEWQFVNGTVIEELTFTMENHGLNICEMEKRLTEVVEQLNIGHLLHESPSTLSGGQKQRVAIAASLVMNPKILVLDEPTAELDPIGKKSILELIKTLNLQFGITVLFVDHNLDITFPYADRVFVVANGEIIADEKPSVLFENPKVTEWLEKPQVIEISHHVIKRNKACWPKHDPLTAGDLSKRILQLYPQLYKSTLPHANYDETTKSNDLAVKLENVFFKYKKSDELTLKDINLEIKKRDFVAIIGHNGAGKSTLSKLIMGINKPSGGKVFINGKELFKMNVIDIVSNVGYVFQSPDYQITQKTVYDEIAFGLKLKKLPSTTIEKKVHDVAQIFNITDYLQRHPHFLSRGERKRVAIASTLVMEPEVVILDEPTTGLDSIRCRKMMDYIQKLREKGITVIFLTHDMGIVSEYIPDTIIVSQGEIKFHGETRRAFQCAADFHEFQIDVPPVIDLSNRLKWDYAALSTEEFIRQADARLRMAGNASDTI